MTHIHMHRQKVTCVCRKSNTLLNTNSQFLVFYLSVKNYFSVLSGWLRKLEPLQQPNLCYSICLGMHATELCVIQN